MGPESVQAFDGFGCLLFRDSAFGLKFHCHRPAEVAPDCHQRTEFANGVSLRKQRLAKRLVGELQCPVFLDGQFYSHQSGLGAERF